MAPKMSNKGWLQMIGAGVVMCIGGPALIVYVTPTEEELFKKYNPDLQRRSLENREKKQQDFDDFVGRLKQYSKSDRPIWEVQKEADAAMRAQRQEDSVRIAHEVRLQQEAIKREAAAAAR